MGKRDEKKRQRDVYHREFKTSGKSSALANDTHREARAEQFADSEPILSSEETAEDVVHLYFSQSAQTALLSAEQEIGIRKRAKKVIFSKCVRQTLLTMILCLLIFILQGCFLPSSQVDPPVFNIGFSICDFNYTGPGGEAEMLTAAVWYPTAEKPSSFTYSNDFTSIIAYDAVPARERGPYPLIVFNHGLYARGNISSHQTI